MQKPWLGRRALIGAGLSMAAAWPASAQDAQDPAPQIAEGDRYDRGVVEVHLNDRGPYRFAVDTAASASVVASDLIEPLDLADQPRAAGRDALCIGPRIAEREEHRLGHQRLVQHSVERGGIWSSFQVMKPQPTRCAAAVLANRWVVRPHSRRVQSSSP